MLYSPEIQPRCCDGRLKLWDFLPDPGIRTHWWVTAIFLKIFGKSVDAEINGRVYHLNTNSFLKWQTRQAAFVPKEKNIEAGQLITQVCINLLNKKIIAALPGEEIYEETYILFDRVFSYSHKREKIDLFHNFRHVFDGIGINGLFSDIELSKDNYIKTLYPTVYKVIENIEAILACVDKDEVPSQEIFQWMADHQFYFYHQHQTLEDAKKITTDPTEMAFIDKLRRKFHKEILINLFGKKIEGLIEQAVIVDKKSFENRFNEHMNQVDKAVQAHDFKAALDILNSAEVEALKGNGFDPGDREYYVNKFLGLGLKNENALDNEIVDSLKTVQSDKSKEFEDLYNMLKDKSYDEIMQNLSADPHNLKVGLNFSLSNIVLDGTIESFKEVAKHFQKLFILKQFSFVLLRFQKEEDEAS